MFYSFFSSLIEAKSSLSVDEELEGADGVLFWLVTVGAFSATELQILVSFCLF